MSKTFKKEIMTDPLLRKSHAHPEKMSIPKVCNSCSGTGVASDGQSECPVCEGMGVVYD